MHTAAITAVLLAFRFLLSLLVLLCCHSWSRCLQLTNWLLRRTFWRIIGSVCVAIPVMAVVLGYRARFSASLLAVFLIVANFVLNGYWTLDYRHPERDFRK